MPTVKPPPPQKYPLPEPTKPEYTQSDNSHILVIAYIILALFIIAFLLLQGSILCQ